MYKVTVGPIVPTPAERAKTIATRIGHAVLLRSDPPSPSMPNEANRIEPMLHHMHADGSVAVLLADEHPLVIMAGSAPHGQLPMMVEITDRAPVSLRQPVRGLLWVTGWLRALDGERARRAAVAVAEQRPDSRLLDVGHGLTMLLLTPASLVLADGEGTDSLRPADFAQANPDPFCRYADQWLRHLEVAHRDVVGMLTQLLPTELRGGHLRPLGLDRCGLRLRVEAAHTDHDVRLNFAQSVGTADELATELRRMVGCPFPT